MMPKISIITPIYDIEGHLDNFISTLSKLNEKLDFEAILINNNRKKKIKKISEIKKKIKNLKIIQNKKNLGYGKACNQGMKIAKGKYFLILNPDVKINADSLKKLAKIAENNKDANIVSCKLLNNDGSIQNSCRRFPTIGALLAKRLSFPFGHIFRKRLKRYNMADYDRKSAKKVDWVSGALMLMREKYYFDERYFMYFEDVDLCRTIGNVYYHPSVFVYHKAGRQSTRNLNVFFYHFASSLRYFMKFGLKK